VIAEIQQNPQRYSKKDKEYFINAGSTLPPVTIQVLEDDLNIEGVLPFDIKGVIIYLRNYNRYLASKELLVTLSDSVSKNPHYTYKQHSKVLGFSYYFNRYSKNIRGDRKAKGKDILFRRQRCRMGNQWR